jgi:IclR family KDG regulon transcriptional repressor
MIEKSSKNGSLEKALEIIECFDRKNPWLTLDEISKRTGYSRTTTFRMICSLEKFGYLRRKLTPGGIQFALGWTFLEKANQVTEQLDIRETAKVEMMGLRDETGLSVQLAIRDGMDAVYIEQFESLKPIRLYPQIGRRAPLYSAACPRVLLAFLPQKEQEKLLESFSYNSYTPNTITTPDQIKQELHQIREKGFAISKGELYEGTFAIAVPIYDYNNSVVAALSLIGLEQDFPEKDLEETIQLLQEKAKIISNKLKGIESNPL